VTFSNPDLLKSEKLLLDLTSTFYCAQLQETNNLFKNVNQTNRGVDKVLTSTIHSLITNLLNQTIVRTNMLVNDENAQSPNETQISLSRGGRTADLHGSPEERQQKIKDSYVMVKQGVPPYVQ